VNFLLAQETIPPPGPHQKANESFLGWGVLVLLVASCVLAGVLAWRRAKTRPSTLPEWDDETFEGEVLGARTPVLVHFSRDWHVGNRAALSQTEILAWQNRGAVVVGLLDIDRNPKTMERFPALEPPAYLLFYQGRKLWHRPGLRQAGELQQDIDVALSREGF
jgi:thioredoxin-like negative regulator of GroEL